MEKPDILKIVSEYSISHIDKWYITTVNVQWAPQLFYRQASTHIFFEEMQKHISL